jgi:ribulose-5-phosphate 4-epimerase/fuculose-1-phosphate aldolase
MEPTMSSSRIEELVAANHILFAQGILDGFGHVSVRNDLRPDRFLISRSMAPPLVRTEDILECDLEGVPHDAHGRSTYLERFIHSEIYRSRADVLAVVHSHSSAAISFGVTGARLRPICHMSGFLGSTTPVFEIRHSAGENSDMLIRNQGLGKALAESLGSGPVALMRGHGSVVVGGSLKQAVYRAIYTEANARIQSMALSLGQATFLTEGEATAAQATNDLQLERPWELWKLHAKSVIARMAS